MAKYLITGGMGFIGFNAALRCSRLGHTAVLFDDLSRESARRNLKTLRRLRPHGLTFVRGDVRRPRALATLVARQRGFDRVLHLAAQVALTQSWKDPRADFEINALGTLNLMEALRRHSPKAQMLFASTNKVYGDLSWASFKKAPTRWTLRRPAGGVPETAPLEFDSPYAFSKGTAEQFVLNAARAHGLKAAVVRQSCVYGPWQYGEEAQGWISWFLRAGEARQGISLFGDGRQTRDLLHIDDLLDFYDAALGSGERLRGQIYNVGGGPDRIISPRELLAWMKVRLPRMPKVSLEARRRGDQKAYASDLSKSRRELGWRPRVSVDEGLSRQLSWLRE